MPIALGRGLRITGANVSPSPYASPKSYPLSDCISQNSLVHIPRRHPHAPRWSHHRRMRYVSGHRSSRSLYARRVCVSRHSLGPTGLRSEVNEPHRHIIPFHPALHPRSIFSFHYLSVSSSSRFLATNFSPSNYLFTFLDELSAPSALGPTGTRSAGCYPQDFITWSEISNPSPCQCYPSSHSVHLAERHKGTGPP